MGRGVETSRIRFVFFSRSPVLTTRGDELELTFYRNAKTAKKLPRKIFVQPNTRVVGDNEDVELIEYPVTVEGVIESFIERDL
jgi:dipeptidyl-peptidase-3